MFTLVGSHINPLLAGCADAGLRLIDTRHEATAGHAAEGYAKATGQPGVCLVTAGPGFTNALTALASCWEDAVPVLFVAGASSRNPNVPNALQGGYDQIEVARPMSKWVSRVEAPDRIPAILAEALAHARSGRPGPVFVEIPDDVARNQASLALPAGQPLPLRCPLPPGQPLVDTVADLLENARRPLILAGGGVRYSGASQALRMLVQRMGIPVLTNFDAHGVLAAGDPAWCGPFSGTLPALPCPPADLLLVLGARFGFLTGGFPGHPADSSTRIIQVDIHPPELTHLRTADLGVVADCRVFLESLNRRLADSSPRRSAAPEWQKQVRGARDARLVAWDRHSRGGAIPPFQVGRVAVATLPADCVFVADGGDAKTWIEMNIAPQQIGQYVSRAYGGALGSGQGLALGAQMAAPGKRVCLFIGDGAWGFHLQEIDTFLRHRLPIIVIVLNNGCWGSTRRGQEQLWQGARFLATDLGATRYDLVAQGFGCHAELVTQADALEPALRRALGHDGPSLLNVLVDPAPDPAQPGD